MHSCRILLDTGVRFRTSDGEGWACARQTKRVREKLCAWTGTHGMVAMSQGAGLCGVDADDALPRAARGRGVGGCRMAGAAMGCYVIHWAGTCGPVGAVLGCVGQAAGCTGVQRGVWVCAGELVKLKGAAQRCASWHLAVGWAGSGGGWAGCGVAGPVESWPLSGVGTMTTCTGVFE